MKNLFIIRLMLLCYLPVFAQAWYGHTLLTWTALQNMPEVINAENVVVESLETFLQKEKEGIIQTLNEIEGWARANVPTYPPTPTELEFHPISQNTKLTPLFLQAIRVNPHVESPDGPVLFVQLLPNQPPNLNRPPVNCLKRCLHHCWGHECTDYFETLEPGDIVSPLAVISTAAEEPDYGFDTGVWENNGTDYGKKYKWGEQPYGGVTSCCSSQVPFHMSFYHESPIFYMLVPQCKRTYGNYRTYLYLTLAKFAFQTQHPYWGWRFLGWALHYPQDLTQPYHASVFPGFSTLSICLIAIKHVLGWSYDDIHLVEAKHCALENYVRFSMVNSWNTEGWKSMSAALSDIGPQESTIPYSHHFLRQVISKEAYDRGAELDQALQNAIPEKYLSPSYDFYVNDPDVDLTKEPLNSEKTKKELDDVIASCFRSFGMYTRIIIQHVLNSVGQKDMYADAEPSL